MEQRPIYFQFQQAGSTVVPIVSPTTTEGVRKVKNFTVNLAPQTDEQFAVFWALVYVPEGTQASALNITGSGTLYEPNQFVINCGMSDPTAGPIRFFTPLSRNLNSGDGVYLVLAPTPTATPALTVQGIARYAIAY